MLIMCSKIMADYVVPKVDANAFHCPHCQSYSDQHWDSLTVSLGGGRYTNNDNYRVGHCRHCEDFTIWKKKLMVYPQNGSAPLPNPDMPELIMNDYNEARCVMDRSPRSACVLLRLCVEKICNEKVDGTGDLNEKIGKLVAQGLDKRIQDAMDSVRIIGGQAVHSLEMNLRDDVDTATKLFKIVNYISEWAYSREKVINEIFDTVPESKKNAIDVRDDKT